MKGEILKAGQEIEMTKDFIIESFGGKTLEIKQGDKAFINNRKIIQYTTGKARGMMQKAECEIQGYDYENISKLIFNKINSQYDFDEIIEENDIDKQELIELIEGVLLDIL